MTAAPVSAERLAAAARAQTGIPEARVFDVRRAWEDRLPDLWGVTVESPARRSNAFFRVADGRVAVPAGAMHAARELSELRPLDGQPWGGGLIYIVTAAGGATPGFPDSWRADEAPRADGGVRMTVQMPASWVAYAAAGGVGPAPANASGPSGGGVTPPAEMATATLDLAADSSLQWRYQLAGREIDGPAGAPADAAPALGDDALVAALDGARRRAAAPRAMPVREPRPLPGRPDVLVVELWALGPVYVAAAGAAPGVDWAHPVGARAAAVRGRPAPAGDPPPGPPAQRRGRGRRAGGVASGSARGVGGGWRPAALPARRRGQERRRHGP